MDVKLFHGSAYHASYCRVLLLLLPLVLLLQVLQSLELLWSWLFLNRIASTLHVYWSAEQASTAAEQHIPLLLVLLLLLLWSWFF